MPEDEDLFDAMSHRPYGATTTADEVASDLAQEIKGKNVLITGTSPCSLGAEAARVIAKYANLVIICGRNQQRILQTAYNIKAETPYANIRILLFDLSSLEEVRQAAATVNECPEPIHVLINSAGVMSCPYTLTSDGLETDLATNYFGPFLFTALIFSRVLAASSRETPCRIVNISSVAHRYSDLKPDNSNLFAWEEKSFSTYARAKHAGILFTNEIARRASERKIDVLAYSLHPGVTPTGIQRHTSEQQMRDRGWHDQQGAWRFPIKTHAQGAATFIVAGFDPSIKDQSGGYLVDCQVSNFDRQPEAASKEHGIRLWKLSEKTTGEPFDI